MWQALRAVRLGRLPKREGTFPWRASRTQSLPICHRRQIPDRHRGLDEVTGGGLPAGRPTLVCGAAGCGKTLFGMNSYNGAVEFGEPGVFIASRSGRKTSPECRLARFRPGEAHRREEDRDRLRPYRAQRDRGDRRIRSRRALHPARLCHRLDRRETCGARHDRDAVRGFENEQVLRAELRRLFGWLKERASPQSSPASGAKAR